MMKKNEVKETRETQETKVEGKEEVEVKTEVIKDVTNKRKKKWKTK